MALFKFGKTVKHQRFNYIPRYYDPDKEDLQERIRAAKGLSDDSPDAMKARISRKFREKNRGSPKTQRSSSRQSNMILIVTLVTLLVLTYILLTRYLPVIERALE